MKDATDGDGKIPFVWCLCPPIDGDGLQMNAAKTADR